MIKVICDNCDTKFMANKKRKMFEGMKITYVICPKCKTNIEVN